MNITINDQEKILLITLLGKEELKLARNIDTAFRGAPHSKANLVITRTLMGKLREYKISLLTDRCSICGKEESEDDLFSSKTFPYGLCKTCYLNSTAE